MDQSLRILIVADDLTGAADSAARCVGAGLHAEIDLHVRGQPEKRDWTPGVAVRAVSSDTRHQSAESAAGIVRGLVEQYQGESRLILYKKIDSTLRGHIGAELDAVLEGLSAPNVPEPCAIICPAFPAQHRGLEDGDLVFTTAQLETQSDAQPDDGASLPARLREQSVHPVAHIALAPVRNGPDELTTMLQGAYQAGARLLAVDGMTERDLATIVAAARKLPQAFLCGSAGLVGTLARRIVQENQTKPAPGNLVIPTGPIWIVVGSGSSMAQRQVAAARQAGVPCYDVLSGEPGVRVQDIAWVQHDTLILHLPEPEPQAKLEGPLARRLAGQLAQTVQAGQNVRAPGVVVVVGGDTAQSVLSVFGLRRLQVVAEVQPGMPLVRTIGADGSASDSGMPYIVLKSGNHGMENTLLELAEWLRTHQAW